MGRTKKQQTKPKKGGRKKGSSMKMTFRNRHPRAAMIITIIIILIIAGAIIAAGVGAAIFFGAFGNELKISKESLKVGFENSTVYDSEGNLIATLSSGTKRKSIKLSEMSEYLPKAYVAIEDERFYDHNGVDIARTGYATVTYLFNKGKSSFGGSTITQQVIKNITQEKDNSSIAGALRKVKEISKAIQVEKYLSKDQILELYLNLIFTAGNDINGVELGSIYYFDKSAKDLSIAECAYMAGINNAPNMYKPFDDFAGKEDPAKAKAEMDDKIKKRTKTVLGKMKELGYISDDQYKQACEETDNGLAFKKGDGAKTTTNVSYHTEAAISQLLDQVMTDNPDMNRDMAEMYLYSSGFKIYTTQNSTIQSILETEIVKPAYHTVGSAQVKNKETGKMEAEKEDSVPTMVIEDYRTGQVVACATATGDKENRTAITKLGYFNYPTEIKKQTGSSMKPIAVIAPGLESGSITGATVFDDCPTSWGSWNPKEWYSGFRGLVNMRWAIEKSANIPNAKALSIILKENGDNYVVDFLKKMDLPDFTDEGLSLSLGGLQHGISPAELCQAYSMIANDGEYITPTYYTKVEDQSGNVVFTPKQEHVQVMSKQNAYIEKNILTAPVTGPEGTAKYCALKGIEVAAKTGTTNDDFDRWLAGFTPYFAATCWYGYNPYNAKVVYGSNPAGLIWDAVMTEIHKDLPNATFEEPEGIIKKSVCKVSGKLAGASCGGSVYTELFTESNVPTEVCSGHSAVAVCNDSHMLATTSCPNVSNVYTSLPEKEIDAPWTSQHSYSGSSGGIPSATCNIHTAGVTALEQATWQAATDAAAAASSGDAAAAAAAQARFEELDRQLQASKAGQPIQPPAANPTPTPQQPTETPQQTTPQTTPETTPQQTPQQPEGQTSGEQPGQGAAQPENTQT